MQSVMCLSVLTVCVGLAYGWGNVVTGGDSNNIYGRWTPSRKIYKCAGYGGLCYQSSHCCEGYVCASKEDVFGDKPGAPGVCVKEKDEQLCTKDAECGPEQECVRVTKGRGRRTVAVCLAASGPDQTKRGKGEGAACEDNSQCDTYAGLCCQEVSIWKVGKRRICHKKRSITKCIDTISVNDIEDF